MNGGSQGGYGVRVQARVNDTVLTPQLVLVDVANTWQQYTVNFTYLAPGQSAVNVLQFGDNAGLSGIKVYFDDISLYPASCTSPQVNNAAGGSALEEVTSSPSTAMPLWGWLVVGIGGVVVIVVIVVIVVVVTSTKKAEIV